MKYCYILFIADYNNEMWTCVVTANSDYIRMIPIPFITLLLFPYLTLKQQILQMFQSFACKHIFD